MAHFLFSEGEDSDSGDRKGWIERRLKELAEIFAVSVGGFSVMDNHLHLLLRLDSHIAEQWKAEEVVNRWLRGKQRTGYAALRLFLVLVNSGEEPERTRYDDCTFKIGRCRRKSLVSLHF